MSHAADLRRIADRGEPTMAATLISSTDRAILRQAAAALERAERLACAYCAYATASRADFAQDDLLPTDPRLYADHAAARRELDAAESAYRAAILPPPPEPRDAS